MNFRRAIVRVPAANFTAGLTRFDLGVPDWANALEQHAGYCAALEECGLQLTRLRADPRHPDATFVEDTAVLLPEGAIITTPGAPSRRGETAAIREQLALHFPALAQIDLPGTVDGGDICVAGKRVLIGVSARTNHEGAAQLSDWLSTIGYSTALVDIRDLGSILHLKSGLTWLGDRLLLIDALAGHPAFDGLDCVRVDADESYAANAVRINDRVLVAAGYPRLAARLDALGYRCLPVAMGEFEKMDGGLSCLSLRF